MSQQNSEILNYKQTAQYIPVTISSGQTTSGVISMGGMQLAGILIPAAWTTCDLTFVVSNVPSTDLNYVGYNLQLTDGANKGPLTIPGVAAGDALTLFPHWFYPWTYVQIVCGTAQGAGRTILLSYQPLMQGIHN